MLGLENHPSYWLVAIAFAIGAFIAWRKDYPGIAAVLVGFALISVLRQILYHYSNSMIK
jgi:hypothetical protein